MQQIEPLNYGKFYHIYNRGVNSCDLFVEPSNYEHFLNLYDKYISLVADTYAWVLMKNHFHLLVRIKEEKEIGYLSGKTLSGYETTERVGAAPSAVHNPEDGFKLKRYTPVHQFSHLFNAYAQAYNKRYGRIGSLFIHPFKRKLIEDKDYFRNLVIYIHNNPVHHGFTEHAMDYPWSSYLTCISIKPTRLQRDAVMGWFDNEANFRIAHDDNFNDNGIEAWLGLY